MPDNKTYMNRNKIRILLIANILIIWIATLSPCDGKAFGHWDKIAHFTLYFSLSIPIVFLHPKDWKLYNGLFFSILMGIIIEFIQQYIPGRNLEIADMIANSSGTIMGAFSSLFYINQKNKP